MSYLPIADDEMVPGRPGKTSLFFRLRDNAISMVTGDDEGAPKIEPTAFPIPGAAGYFLRGCTYPGIQDVVLESGTMALVPDPQEFNADEGFRFSVHRTGQYAFKLNGYIDCSDSSNGDLYLQVYKNGAPFGALRHIQMISGVSGQASYVEFLNFSEGDIAELYFRHEESGLGTPPDLYVQVAWGIGSDVPYNFYLTKILEIF